MEKDTGRVVDAYKSRAVGQRAAVLGEMGLFKLSSLTVLELVAWKY